MYHTLINYFLLIGLAKIKGSAVIEQVVNRIDVNCC